MWLHKTKNRSSQQVIRRWNRLPSSASRSPLGATGCIRDLLTSYLNNPLGYLLHDSSTGCALRNRATSQCERRRRGQTNNPADHPLFGAGNRRGAFELFARTSRTEDTALAKQTHFYRLRSALIYGRCKKQSNTRSRGASRERG